MPTTLQTSPADPAAAPAERQLTGRKVLLIFCAFFGVVFAMNAYLVRMAVSTFGGVEVASAYRAGLDYPRELAATAQQDRLGWSVTGRVTRRADGSAEIVIEARDRGGQALTGAAVAATLQRPADRRLDRPVPLAESGAGSYRATLADLEPGQWDLDLAVTARSGETFRSRNRVILN